MKLYRKKLKRYIFVATKTEAQAFVELFGLKKNKRNGYTVYHDNSENIEVIVSGVGVANAANAAKAFTSLKNSGAVYNVGIAAAPSKYPIGSVEKIGSILYHDKTITLEAGATLQTLDTPCSEYKNTLVDMEGFGFASILPDITLYKIVSDHFEPRNLTKEGVKNLIKEALVSNSHRICL